jgi:hypothetical protein
MMAGKIPAVIREIVERSKLAAVDTIQPGEEFQIQDDDLAIATLEMEEHIRRATPTPEDARSDREKAADRLGGWLEKAARVGWDGELSSGAAFGHGLEMLDDEEEPVNTR